jgi:membrane protease YdiL (CAAX protease family)
MDTYFGLFLVAVEEEVLFRGVMIFLLKKITNNFYVILFISSVLFGAAHWSIGIYNIIFNSIIGAIYFIAVWHTGSILPSAIAHFICNYFFSILIAAW